MSDKLSEISRNIDGGAFDSAKKSDGKIKLAENVFASIIKNYTLEIPEVIKFASGSLVDSLVEMIGKKNANRPIVVDIDSKDQVEVTVNLILKFGCHVPTVAAKIQKVIDRKIEEITGKDVIRVNVNIVDLHHDSNTQEEKEEE
jgi:uncharacterized alkaline shock family protein YloU